MTPRFITYIKNVLQVQIFFGWYAWQAERTKNPLYAALNHVLCAVNGTGAHLIYGHAVAILVPLKLVRLGILNESGYLAWLTITSFLYPVVVTGLIGPAQPAKTSEGE